MISFLLTLSKVLVAVPFLCLIFVVVWFGTVYSSLPEWGVIVACVLFAISFVYMVYVNYKELESNNSLIIGTGLSTQATLRHYIRAVLMPVVPHFSFFKQIRKITTKHETY